MTESGHGTVIDMALSAAAMVCREGRHDFRCIDGQECETANLCGLCVHRDGLTILRLHAVDLDIEWVTPANDLAAVPFLRFRRGTAADLGRWHAQLSGLSGSFVPRDSGQTRAA